MSLAAVILAAGLGKRMKSALPKVLHPAHGRPLISWVADAARSAGAVELVAVVGPEMTPEDRHHHLSGFGIAEQRERLGTGHATMQAMPVLGPAIDEIVVLCGDVPCVRAETIRALVETRRRADAGAAVLTMVLDDPAAYGRIVRGKPEGSEPGPVLRIVEARDASDEEKAIREVNSGTYAFSREDLTRGLAALRNDNAQGEYYLTDVVRECVAAGRPVAGVIARDPDEMLGVNTPDELELVGRVLAARSIDR